MNKGSRWVRIIKAGVKKSVNAVPLNYLFSKRYRTNLAIFAGPSDPVLRLSPFNKRFGSVGNGIRNLLLYSTQKNIIEKSC